MWKKFILAIFVMVAGILLASQQPAGVEIPIYLTYTQDPTTSMTVQWHSEKTERQCVVRYRQKGNDRWLEKKGSSLQAASSSTFVHSVVLTGLSPKTYYEFSVQDMQDVYQFRTLPKDLENDSVRFVIGGDAYRNLAFFRKTSEKIAKKDPDFIVVGGDIAYTDSSKTPFQGKQREVKRWNTFFSEWFNTMRGKEGRLIPIVAVVGNHDVPRNIKDPQNEPILFYQMFAFPQGPISYRCIDAGSYLSLVLLDSDHSYPVMGEQTQWLEKSLKERDSIPYKMAIYHVSAYPSVYMFNSKVAKKIRENWSPLFEAYGVRFAFEHHNHAYKRTFPIKQGAIADDGVIYMGDGSWGVTPRKPHSRAWYLEKKSKINCFNLVTVSKGGCDVIAFSSSGRMVDKAPKWVQ